MRFGSRCLGSLAAIAALLATTISAGPTAATVSPVTMDITIGYDCVEGDKGFLPSVTLTLKHADGSVIDTGNDSNPSPNFAVCFSHQPRQASFKNLTHSGRHVVSAHSLLFKRNYRV